MDGSDSGQLANLLDLSSIWRRIPVPVPRAHSGGARIGALAANAPAANGLLLRRTVGGPKRRAEQESPRSPEIVHPGDVCVRVREREGGGGGVSVRGGTEPPFACLPSLPFQSQSTYSSI